MNYLIDILFFILIAIIIFQAWYISKLRKTIEFAVESLRRYANALVNDDFKEIERVNDDIKNYK